MGTLFQRLYEGIDFIFNSNFFFLTDIKIIMVDLGETPVTIFD